MNGGFKFENGSGLCVAQSIVGSNRVVRGVSERKRSRLLPDMSYDAYLLQPMPGEDPLATVRATLNVETEVINPGPPNAEAEVRTQQLTRALIAETPALEPFEFGCRTRAHRRNLGGGSSRSISSCRAERSRERKRDSNHAVRRQCVYHDSVLAPAGQGEARVRRGVAILARPKGLWRVL